MSARIVLCPSCDQAVTLPPYEHGKKCVCPVCGALLRSGHLNTIKNSAICAIATLILLFCAIFQPFLSIESLGIYHEIALSSIFGVLKSDWSLLLTVFLLFTFLLPTVMLLQQILIGLCGQSPERIFCKLYAFCHRFCMVDVFVFGVIVSLVKLTSLARVNFHAGFYLGFIASMLLIYCWVKVPPTKMWDAYMPSTAAPRPGIRGIEQGFIYCKHCGCVYLAEKHHHCPRCRQISTYRIAGSRQRTLALLLAALILYLPANLYPIMFTTYLGNAVGSNIVDGVISLWDMNSQAVALIILFASIFIPVFKIVLLLLLIYLTRHQQVSKPAWLSGFYRVISFIGKWSMIDVFVVIIMSATVRMSGLLTIDPGFAIIAFCAVVLITMAAAELFDERLIWDNFYAGTERSTR